MIEVTKLNDVKIIINADLIETIEAAPDAVITLLVGRKLLLRKVLMSSVKLFFINKDC